MPCTSSSITHSSMPQQRPRWTVQNQDTLYFNYFHLFYCDTALEYLQQVHQEYLYSAAYWQQWHQC